MNVQSPYLQPKVRYVLPADAVILDASTTGAMLAKQFEKVLSRQHSRLPSRALSADLTTLLEEFRRPSTIVEAATRYAQKSNSTAREVLKDALGPLQELLAAGYIEPESEQTVLKHSLPETVAAVADSVQLISTKDQTALFRVLHQKWGSVVVRVARAGDEQGCKRILTEAAALRKLQGLPVPVVFECVQDATYHWLVTSWIEGRQLGAYIQDMRRIPYLFAIPCRAVTALSLLELVAAMHERGVLHGDINPKNFVVDVTGHVHAIDFESASSPGTQHFIEEASPYYSAPEQVRKTNEYQFFSPTSFSEQFSTAVVSAEILFDAVRPDLSLSLGALLELVLHGRLWTGKLSVMCSRHALMGECLARALSFSQVDRYPSLRVMAVAFSEASQAMHCGLVTEAPDYVSIGQAVNRILHTLVVGAVSSCEPVGGKSREGHPADVALASSFIGPIDTSRLPEAAVVLHRLLPISPLDWTPALLAWAVELLSPHSKNEADMEAGLAAGAGARLLLIANLFELHPAEELRQMGDRLALWNEQVALQSCTHLGVAHGVLGNMLGIAHWGRVSQSAVPINLLSNSLQRIEQEWQIHQSGSPIPMGWWCRGLPGYITLLCALAHHHRQSNELREMLIQCVKHLSLLPSSSWTICCGTLGRALSLAQASRTLADDSLRVAALDLVEESRLESLRQGFVPSIWKGSWGPDFVYSCITSRRL